MGSTCSTRKSAASLFPLEKLRYEKAGQGHVLDHYETLTQSQREDLLEELSSFDPDHINYLFQKLVLEESAETNDENNFERVEPSLTQDITEEFRNQEPEEYDRIKAFGLQKIKAGKVAVVILAGGQGSRLGFDHPKGMYNIGLPS